MQQRLEKLAADLDNARELSQRIVADKAQLQNEKTKLTQQLAEQARLTNLLNIQLKWYTFISSFVVLPWRHNCCPGFNSPTDYWLDLFSVVMNSRLPFFVNGCSLSVSFMQSCLVESSHDFRFRFRWENSILTIKFSEGLCLASYKNFIVQFICPCAFCLGRKFLSLTCRGNVFFLFFSLSASTPSVSPCSSRGSLSLSGSRGSLSASSRGSLNSLNYPDMNHSGLSEPFNLRELHQRVTEMLQGMSREAVTPCPPIRTTGAATSYTLTSGRASHASNSSQVSLSSRDSMSLSSHSPPVSPITSDLSPTHSPATARIISSEGESTSGLDVTELERNPLPLVSPFLGMH